MLNNFQVDKLKVQVFETRSQMGQQAAILVADKIKELLSIQETVNIIFAAAPSQNEFLQTLINQQLDWNRVNAFHMDEYIGLSAEATQRFGNFLKEAIFKHLPFLSVHYINGNAEDLVAEMNGYANLLSLYPADIVCMGIGENGHIAFNDPPVADFYDPAVVKKVELDDACRVQQVNDGCFQTKDQVPTHAITLTIPTLMNGRFIYCIVPGSKKAEAVSNTLRKVVEEKYPSTILRKHNNAILFLDADSSALI